MIHSCLCNVVILCYTEMNVTFKKRKNKLYMSENQLINQKSKLIDIRYILIIYIYYLNYI